MSTSDGKDAPASSNILLSQPIVIDNGTATVKAGFAGGSKPKVTIGNKVGRTKHMRIMPGGALDKGEQEGRSTFYVGRKLDEHRGAFRLEYPMDKGYIVDGGWEAMESVWEHVYDKENLNASTDEHPVLMTEAPLNPRRNRERVAEVFFENYRAPAMFFSPQAVLSLYAGGRTTGVVLDVGEGLAHAVPVYEGFALVHSVQRSDVAGRDVTNYLKTLLRRSGGLTASTTAETDLVRRMKEEVCYVQSASGTDGNAAASIAKTPYQLPDGTTVQLGAERHQAPEILFRPEIIGSEEMAVSTALVQSILGSDMDLRPTLFEQILLSGGSTLYPGFGDRVLQEVRKRAPERTRIRISAPPDRIHSSWSGGSILASLSTFKNMWVSKGDYDEYGSNIVHRRSL